MAKTKATISIDRAKVDEARRLTGARSNSATIDLALVALIRAERIRQDVAAYAAAPATPDEISLATASTAAWSDLADDTDWDGVYSDDV